MKISIAIIFESENINTFKNDFIQNNRQYIDNINSLNIETKIELPVDFINFN